MAEPILSVEHVQVRYGSVPAIHDLTLHVDEGEIVTVLGANGAGKTTTLRMISGLHRPYSGKVFYEGEEIQGRPAHELVGLGLGHVPEGRRIFSAMTVRENLEMGAFGRHGNFSADFDHVYGLFPVLGERQKQLGGTLSGGEQQMLAIGRALMSEPKLLMLDEPSLGLAPQIVAKIFEIIRQINEKGVPILLVEQNARQALRIAHRGYVIVTGKNQLTGTGAELLASDEVRQAYLGE